MPPNYDFAYEGNMNVLDPVCFTVTGTTAGSKYIWDFGDGTVSTAVAPCHLYSSQGTYLVRLTVDSDTAHAVLKGLKMIWQEFTEYTPLLGGSRRWHHIVSHYTGAAQVNDTLSDTTFAVLVINHTTVCIGTDTIPFKQTLFLGSDTVISFLKVLNPQDMNYNAHALNFYIKANSIYYDNIFGRGDGNGFQSY